jgi:hypothetical protein
MGIKSIISVIALGCYGSEDTMIHRLWASSYRHIASCSLRKPGPWVHQHTRSESSLGSNCSGVAGDESGYGLVSGPARSRSCSVMTMRIIWERVSLQTQAHILTKMDLSKCIPLCPMTVLLQNETGTCNLHVISRIRRE